MLIFRLFVVYINTYHLTDRYFIDMKFYIILFLSFKHLSFTVNLIDKTVPYSKYEL